MHERRKQANQLYNRRTRLPWKITVNNWTIQKKNGTAFPFYKKRTGTAFLCVPVRLEPCVSGKQQWQTQDAANIVFGVVAVLVIFFEAKLFHALQYNVEYCNHQPETVMLACRLLAEKQQRTPRKVGHCDVLMNKLRDEIVRHCKYDSIQRASSARRCTRGATRDEHCQQLIVDARNHVERGIEVDLLSACYSDVLHAQQLLSFSSLLAVSNL